MKGLVWFEWKAVSWFLCKDERFGLVWKEAQFHN